MSPKADKKKELNSEGPKKKGVDDEAGKPPPGSIMSLPSMLAAEEEVQDPSTEDRDPPDMGPLHLKIADSNGHDHLPKFDFDDGRWTVDAKILTDRVSARKILYIVWSSISQMLVLLLTCGATEQDLNYGFERYPLYTKKYGNLGAGKYKHVMRVNRDDLHQAPVGHEDVVPENYRYAPGVSRSIVQTAERLKRKAANAASIAPGGTGGGGSPAHHNPILDPVVQLPVAERTKHDHMSQSSEKREPTTMETAGQARSIGGMKGNAEAHGRIRPARKLKIFEEVRIVVYANKEVIEHRKSAVWVSGEIISQNKKEHKLEKEKLNKLKRAEERMAKDKEAIAEKKSGKHPPKKTDKPEMSLASRMKD